MKIDGARVLVVGATGVLGELTARALAEGGAALAITGRDADRLATLASELGATSHRLDLVDVDGAATVVNRAAIELGGLDLLVVATGVPAFGPAIEADPAVTEELFAVDTLGPMAVVRSAARHLTASAEGVAVVLTAILADTPSPQMAEYSAAKAALSSWLTVLRRENRRAFRVVDVRPPHLDTGLASRALAGEPPRLPEPLPAGVVVDAILRAVGDDRAAEIAWDPRASELVVR